MAQTTDQARLIEAVRASLTPDLLHPRYMRPQHPMAGHCYIACQALYHLTGRRLRLYRSRPGGLAWHFYLRDLDTGDVIDPTADQFDDFDYITLDYGAGVEVPFRTKHPDKTARVVIKRARQWLAAQG